MLRKDNEMTWGGILLSLEHRWVCGDSYQGHEGKEGDLGLLWVLGTLTTCCLVWSLNVLFQCLERR